MDTTLDIYMHRLTISDLNFVILHHFPFCFFSIGSTCIFPSSLLIQGHLPHILQRAATTKESVWVLSQPLNKVILLMYRKYLEWIDQCFNFNHLNWCWTDELSIVLDHKNEDVCTVEILKHAFVQEETVWKQGFWLVMICVLPSF